MEQPSTDRRKEERYPIETKAILRKKNGEIILAAARDISSSGMRLEIEQAYPLKLDDEVTIEVELPDRPDKPFSSWGVGRVAWMDVHGAGIELCAGQFNSRPSGGREACRCLDEA